MIPFINNPSPDADYVKYSEQEREGLVARLGVARLGAFRLGYLGVQTPDDGPNDGFATWKDGTDISKSTTWTEGDDFK